MSEKDVHSEKSTSSDEAGSEQIRECDVTGRIIRENGSCYVLFDVSPGIATDVAPHVSGELTVSGDRVEWVPENDADVQTKARELARRFGQRIVARERLD